MTAGRRAPIPARARVSVPALVGAFKHLESAADDPDRLLHHAVSGARELFGADASWCAIASGGPLRIVAQSGLRHADTPVQWQLELGHGIGGRVAESGEATIVRDYRRDPRRTGVVRSVIDDEGLRSGVVVPLWPRVRSPRARAHPPGSPQDDADSDHFRALPRSDHGTDRVGVLYVSDRQPHRYSAEDVDAAGAFAAAVGALYELDVARRSEGARVELRLRARFLEDLLDADADESRLADRATLLGVDLGVRRAVAVIGSHVGVYAGGARAPVLTGRVLEVLRASLDRGVTADVTVHDGDVVALVEPVGERAVLRQDVRDLLIRASLQLSGVGLAAGIGRECRRAGDYPESFREARLALDVARRRRAAGAVIDAAELGVYGVLGEPNDPGRLRAHALKTLAPVLAGPGAEDGEALRTLRAWLAADRRLEGTARRLELHVNTVRGRLQRIEQRLDVDLHDPDACFEVELAVRVLAVVGADGTRPT